MPNTVIQLKKSATVSAKPADLANGELAINFADGKLFYKNTAGFIAEFSSGSNFGTINANGTLVVSDTSGDILTLLAGNNITIVGDAVNDRITVGLSSAVSVASLTSTGVVTGSELTSTNASGDEGGQVNLTKPPNATTNGTSVVIDAFQNRVRIFENGGAFRGAFIDLSAAAAGVGSNLLAGGSGTDATARDIANSAFAKANAALANTNGATFAGSLTVSTNLTADRIISTNNGNGENFRVGDDAWIGDTNIADTIRIKGQQNSANAFIAFGNNDGVLLGRAGSGNLTYGGNTVWHSGIDGAGSGLDADLLDGQQGTYYATATDSTAAFARANIAVANVNYVNTAMQAAFTRANTGISNTENVVFAGNNFFFTGNVRFVGSATRITYTSDSVFITNGAQTNKPALQIEAGAGTGGISIGRGTFGVTLGHDIGNQTYISSTNWGGLAFNAIGNSNHQANNGLFRFTGDANSYAASNGVIQVVATPSVGFYVRFTKDALTSTSNLRANDVFTVNYSGNVNTLGSIESTGLKVVGTANITSNLVVQGADVFSTMSSANTSVGTGANAFASATIAGANTVVGTGANSFATSAAAGANAFMISVQNGSNTAVGAGANAFSSATIAGANTAVGTGANTVGSAAFARANSALANSTGTFNGALTVAGALNVTGLTTLSSNLSVGGALVRSWSATNTDIDALIPGSTFGTIIEGTTSGHLVLGIRDNDVNDSLSIISGGGDYTTASTYDKTVAFFRADGRVGIGTTSPQQALQVNDSIRVTAEGANSIAELRGGNADGAVLQLFRGGNTSQFAGFSQFQGSLFIKNYDSGPIIFNTTTSDTERMRITNGGDVGIGTTSPGKRLDVVGQSRISGAAASGYALMEYGTSATAANNWHVGSEGDGTFRWYNGNFGSGTERMRITSAGLVGIGTSSPAEKLHVNSGAAEFAIQWDSTGSNSWVLGSATNRAYIRNKTNTTEVLTILNGGNIGIGATTPTNARLHVQRASGAAAGGEIWGSDGTYWFQLNSRQIVGAYSPLVANNDHALIYSDGTSNTGALVIGQWSSFSRGIRIDASGNVGIGRSDSSYRLDVAGTINASNVLINGAPISAGGSSGGYYQGNNGAVGSASGLGDIFRVHTNILNANVTIFSGNNALAAGPITVNVGRTLTIQSNARVAIV